MNRRATRTPIGLAAGVVVAVLGGAATAARAQAPAGVVEYYHLDALGSVRLVTNAAGAPIRTHDYLPFGEPSGGTPGVTSPKMFTGHERDAPTGLDYFGARYYRADLGRFTTIDPVYTWTENLVEGVRDPRGRGGVDHPPQTRGSLTPRRSVRCR